MRRLSIVVSVLAVVVVGADAEIIEMHAFDAVSSSGRPEEQENDVRTFTSAAAEPYTLGTIEWDGIVDPTADPNDPESFPTFADELFVAITHLPSNTRGALQLGSGAASFQEGTQFAGSYFDFNGLQIAPGDEFELEFYEAVNDPEVDPDALWRTIRFDFNDDYNAPVHPLEPGPDTIRLDATGRQSFPTNIPLGEAGQFWGLQYGSGGDGPSITSMTIDGHDAESYWFETRFEDGMFQANVLDGVGMPSVMLLDEAAGEPGTFSGLRLEFPPGDFAPGDAIRFGLSFGIADHPAVFFASGADLARLSGSGPLAITVEFADGGQVTELLDGLTPEIPHSSFADLDVRERFTADLPGDFDADGDVDGDDLIRILLGAGILSDAKRDDGDADGDGDVDRDDLGQWQENFGGGISAVPGRSEAVPEPSAVSIAALLSLIAWCSAARRRGDSDREQTHRGPSP